MRTSCLLAFALALAGCAGGTRAIDAEDKKARKNTDLGDINAEVSVLQLLHALAFTEGQTKKFAELAAECAPEAPPKTEIEASEKYRQALLDLRAALRENDGEKIVAADAALAELREKESPEFESIEITDEARKAAAKFFGEFSARQLVFYLSSFGDSFPDPNELISEALAASRELKGKEWQAHRDATASDVGLLVAGLDAEKEEKVREKVTAILDKAAGLKDDEFDSKKADLEKEARKLTGELASLDFVRHYLQRVLAEGLSNHRAVAAVEGRAKK